ncbi:uncharacterized protein LOC135804533 [Sycon ciliatum]|uniref:uncharacterized protein LOC135804533 n=1 Tax=Sycon ciliatum TaxID=27933 RepID=UPI0031F6959B
MLLSVTVTLVAILLTVFSAKAQDFGDAPTRVVFQPIPAVNGTQASITCVTTSEVERNDVELFRDSSMVQASDRIMVNPPRGPAGVLERTWTFNPVLLSDMGTYRCRFAVTLPQAVVRVVVPLAPSTQIDIQACSVYRVENDSYYLPQGHMELLDLNETLRRNDSDVIRPDAGNLLVCQLVSASSRNLAAGNVRWFRHTVRAEAVETVPVGTGEDDISIILQPFVMDRIWLVGLNIPRPDRDDAGSYTFELITGSAMNVSNCSMENDQCNYPLLLNTGPSIETGLENFETNKGSAKTAMCVATGVPAPTITWLFENRALDLTSTSRIFVTVFNPVNGNPFRVRSVLTLTDTQYDDRGNYRCVVQSVRPDGLVIGNTDSTALFRVRDPIGAVWPFLGLCGQFLVLIVILYADRYRRIVRKRRVDDETDGGADGSEDETDGQDENEDNEHLTLLFRCPRGSESVRYRPLNESEL